MPQDKGKGQEKLHQATRTNPETGETESKEFTQTEWRDRDKAAGWTRDVAESDLPDSDSDE